jgi:diguanylate cyclase (GGDEF)-like protein/PAS domain S-box-containing protein
MPDSKIVIVEDDAIIGRHIQVSLKRLGYTVLAVFLSGEEAIAQIGPLNPDLILMDISLAGEIDGVEAARLIHSHYNIPIIYLTAFADQQTLQRAKITDPFGYLLKPFDERILKITVEMALYKYQMERRLIESEELLRTLVENQGEGVAIVNPEGVFIFCNPALYLIFDVPRGQLVGRNISEFTDKTQLTLMQHHAAKLQQGEKAVYETVLIRLDGSQRFIAVTATPWIDKNGAFAGSFAIVSDITIRKRIEEAELNARRLAEALHSTAAILNSSLEVDEVLDLVLANVGRVVPSDGVNLMLIEGDWARIVRNYFTTGADGQYKIMNKSIAWHKTEVLRRLAETGHPLVISHFNSLEGGLPTSMHWIQSYVGAPLRIKGQILGFLNLGSLTDGFYKDQHANQLDAFALQAGMAIENARLFREARKRAHFLGLLNEITRMAISAVDEDQTMNGVTEKINHLFGADGTFITTWNEELQRVISVTGFGHAGEVDQPVSYLPDKLTFTASVLQAGHALIVNDVSNSPYIDGDLAQTFSPVSAMGLPLIADGARLGAIIIGFKDPHSFTQEEIEKGEQVSSQVALAIAKVRLYVQVQKMAITDDLTGLYNRRGIFEKGRTLLSDTQKKSAPLALIWMDIDYFKHVNDTYGHYIGDQVVCGVAKRCQTNLNGQGVIGRYGGEGGDELIVLLPEMDLVEAHQVAERLRQQVANQPFSTEKDTVSVTVSMGVSVLKGQTMDLPGLLNRADQAMYAAKAAGKNCVVISEET